MPKSHAFGSSFYESWNVSNHKALSTIEIHNAKIGVQCSKMVVGNFGSCEGTVVKELESGKIIADMSGENRRQTILSGGKGGNGNQHYAT